MPVKGLHTVLVDSFLALKEGQEKQLSVVLEVKNLSKSFIGVQALKDISLTIRAGEIHCLAGENGCGKSTLVKSISGVYTPDLGEIILNGHSYHSLTPVQAMHEGVQVIYQDLSLFSHMSAAENIAIGRLKFENRAFVNWKEIHRIAEEQLRKIGVEMDLTRPVGELSMANRQLTAILRALAQNAKILFMDEPTTALTKKEVERLLHIMEDLKEKGLAIVFISHKLDEIFSVADTITIFRDGEKIGDFESSELNERKLSYYMTGREVEYPRYHRTRKETEEILELRDLGRRGQYENISLKVRPGDIIGLTGLLGAGRTEIAMSLFGLNPVHKGSVYIDKREVRLRSPMEAKRHGIALVPEDRFRQGLFIERKIKENISSVILDRISTRGILNRKEEALMAQTYVDTLKVRTPSIDTVVGTLSGGNQQKVVIAKWTAAKPRVFIMDTPTVGIDIGSKSEIYEQIHSFARDGMAVILISDEIQEILANCNRVLVLAEGKEVAFLEEEDLNREDAAERLSELIGGQGGQKDETGEVVL